MVGRHFRAGLSDRGSGKFAPAQGDHFYRFQFHHFMSSEFPSDVFLILRMNDLREGAAGRGDNSDTATEA